MTIVGRVYLERGEPVTVLVQWGCASRGETHGGPRNVLILRGDGSRVVRPFRGLRRQPELDVSPQPKPPLERLVHDRAVPEPSSAET